MNEQLLNKLDWQDLITILLDFCQTPAGQRQSKDLTLGLSKHEIIKRWNQVEPLCELKKQGYYPSIGELPEQKVNFRKASLGQILSAEELYTIGFLLKASSSIYRFCNDFSRRCSTLEEFKNRIISLPKLAAAIERAVDETGELKDDASPELAQIRKKRSSLARRIEQKLQNLCRQNETVSQYLQDDFYTLRSERYVIPIKLDGRGRVDGPIIDTSSSGQTLFMEPKSIAPLNEELRELAVAEKLEIIKIFKKLSAMVATHLSELEENYRSLIELDCLSAQALLAEKLHCNRIELRDEPCLELYQARHPLLWKHDKNSVVANDIVLKPEQQFMIVTGPNAGGKTVVLKTVGLTQAMLSVGLLLPWLRIQKPMFLQISMLKWVTHKV